jgi:hypothetical protein
VSSANVRRPLGRFRGRREDNIKVDVKETGWESVDYIHVAQDRDNQFALLNMVINLRVPKQAGKLLRS